MVSPDDDTVEDIYQSYFEEIVGNHFVEDPYDTTDLSHRLINNSNQTKMKEKYGAIGANKAKGISALVSRGRFEKSINLTHGNVLDKKWKEVDLTGTPDWDVIIKEDVIEDVLSGRAFAAKYFK